MRFLTAATTLLLAHLSVAVPITNSRNTDVAAREIDSRAGPLAIGTFQYLTDTLQDIDICEALVVANVVDTSIKIWETFDDINDEHHKVEEDFTKKVVHDLRKEYPDYNVLVYHGKSLY